MKIFTGICDAKQLILISHDIIGTGMTRNCKNYLCIPISKRSNCYRVLAANGKALSMVSNRAIRLSRATVARFDVSEITKVFWTSRSKNQLIAERRDDRKFQLTIVEQLGISTYRRSVLPLDVIQNLTEEVN